MKKVFVLLVLSSLCSCSLRDDFSGNPEGYPATRLDQELLGLNQRTISSSNLVTLPNGVVVEKINDNLFRREWDMLFDSTTVKILGEVPSRSCVTKTTSLYWPYGEVYYEYDTNLPDTAYIRQAMNLISSNTSIVFKAKKPSTTNYVHFQYDSAETSSFVGKKGGRQVIKLKKYHLYGAVAHEILHALGFEHEHSRPDRDSYIIVDETNILPQHLHNYEKLSSSMFRTVVPFDRNSIMMYSSYSGFAINPSLPVMTSLYDNPTIDGQRDSLSVKDIAGIEAVYGPPYHRLETTVNYVVQNYAQGITEIYEEDLTTRIAFYADKSCTIPLATTYPRDITLTEYHTVVNNYSNPETYVQSQTITIPAGTTYYYYNTHYRNLQWYYNSDCYQQSTYYYEITPQQASDTYY